MTSLIGLSADFDPTANVFTGRRFVGFVTDKGKEPPLASGYLRVPAPFRKSTAGLWVLDGPVEWPRARLPWGRLAMVGVWLGMGVEDYDPLAVIPLDVEIPRGAKLRFQTGDLAFDAKSLTDFAKALVRGAM